MPPAEAGPVLVDTATLLIVTRTSAVQPASPNRQRRARIDEQSCLRAYISHT